jgi:putative phosphoribosyl transferase
MESPKVSEIVVPLPEGSLNADLVCPTGAHGLVLLPQCASSSREAARHGLVAHTLQENGLATLTVHMLLPVEAAQSGLRPDADRLADRLQRVSSWSQDHEPTRGLPLGLFGAGADVEVVLRAAASESCRARAIATQGGRADLLGVDLIARIRAATLLIVGSRDPYAVECSRAASQQLRCMHRIAVVPGATHAFAESGAVERAALHAAHWFRRHMGAASYRPPIAEEACVE